MPYLWGKDDEGKKVKINVGSIIAILTSDIHARHEAPVAREEGGKAWYIVMRNWFEAVSKLRHSLWHLGKIIPVIVAGDVLHKWNSPPELINFLNKHMFSCYAVPGQHDLPYHNYEDLRKSAYCTLAEGRTIEHLEHGVCSKYIFIDKKDGIEKYLRMWGVPWGKEIPEVWDDSPSNNRTYNLAVVHKYIWADSKTSHLEASKESHINTIAKELKDKGYDGAVFGDNHKGFIRAVNGVQIFNGGAAICQKLDEKDYEPHLGLLLADRRIVTISTKMVEKWNEDHLIGKSMIDKTAGDVIDALTNLLQKSIDFDDVVKHHMEEMKVPQSIRMIILKALEERGPIL